ncbi:332_t:CDS:2, partial [Ambispora leptoticha]
MLEIFKEMHLKNSREYKKENQKYRKLTPTGELKKEEAQKVLNEISKNNDKEYNLISKADKIIKTFEVNSSRLNELKKIFTELIVDGNLAKNKVIELALQLDIKLLQLLKSSPEIKKIFFVEIDDILVFDKTKFQNFISNKQFLPDSFTQYKNKIGLVADRQYLANSVLTNFWKYDCGKEVPMTDISLNDNLIIKGNNLLSLYSLKERYQGKIKLIYIDPPYNPDSKSNTFVYNNGFNESTWLTFMKNRLEVAKKLLTNDGCLIVAIDKNEQAELT